MQSEDQTFPIGNQFYSKINLTIAAIFKNENSWTSVSSLQEQATYTCGEW